MKVFVSTNKKREWVGCEKCAETVGFKTVEKPGEIILNKIFIPGVSKLFCDECFKLIYERGDPQ